MPCEVGNSTVSGASYIACPTRCALVGEKAYCVPSDGTGLHDSIPAQTLLRLFEQYAQ